MPGAIRKETPDSRANPNMEVKTPKGGSPTTSMAEEQMALKSDEQAKTELNHSQGRRMPGAIRKVTRNRNAKK